MAEANAIVAEHLVKTYGEVRAVDGVSLEVPRGSVLCMLGPNGAGKTTTVRILTTLLRPDGGRATVAGFDVVRQAQDVRRGIGVSGQYAAVDENLTGFENLDMVGQLYGLARTRSRQRAGELLERFTLTKAAHRPVKTYSGGMRRRLDLAGSLVAEPPVLFLDEPTTGLDPRSRSEMWELISALVRGGATLLLTTQYLEEADLLADSIIVIDHGKVIAQGTSDELKRQTGGERLEVTVASVDALEGTAAVLAAVGSSQPTVDPHTRQVTVGVDGGTPVLIEALRRLDGDGVVVTDVAIRRPTLDEVFLNLTGSPAGDAAVRKEAS